MNTLAKLMISKDCKIPRIKNKSSDATFKFLLVFISETKKIIMKIAVTVLTAITLTSCFHKHYVGAGNITQEERNVPTYHSIISDGSIDVFITHDSSYVVLVEAGSNLMDYIETDVVNDQLIIRQLDSDIINTKPVKIYLNCDSIHTIELNGSGDLDTELITSNTFSVSLNGSGNIDANINAATVNSSIKGSGNLNLLGTCIDYNGITKGSGNVYARYLNTTNANMDIEGSGNATITVTKTLNAIIAGSGNIYYYGSPSSATSEISGSGNLIEM